MDRRMLADFLARLQRVERGQIHHRVGTVTATNPLSVALGGADTSLKARSLVNAGLADGDVVSVLTFGHDIIVLGKIVSAPQRVVWGVVNSNGTIADVGSGDWSVTRTSFSNYRVTFDPVFPAAPAVFAQPDGGSAHLVYKSSAPTASQATFNPLTTGVATYDNKFSFQAIGHA